MDQVSNIRKMHGTVHVSLAYGVVMLVPSPLFLLRPLHAGEAVDRDEYMLWLRQNEFPYALALAVRYLAACERSRMEVCARLNACGYSPETAGRAVEYLIQRGLLNDTRMAEQYVQSRSAKAGRIRIAQDLKRKGIQNETAANAMASLDEDIQTGRAARLAMQFAARKNSVDPRTLNQRIIGMLMRRGYTFTQSRQAAGKAVALHADINEDVE
jgi:regulatory protein